MRKLFTAEAWIEDAADMMDLCAPDSILKEGVDGAVGGGEIELAYRLSTALVDLRRVERDHAQHHRPAHARHAPQPELASAASIQSRLVRERVVISPGGLLGVPCVGGGGESRRARATPPPRTTLTRG